MNKIGRRVAEGMAGLAMMGAVEGAKANPSEPSHDRLSNVPPIEQEQKKDRMQKLQENYNRIQDARAQWEAFKQEHPNAPTEGADEGKHWISMINSTVSDPQEARRLRDLYSELQGYHDVQLTKAEIVGRLQDGPQLHLAIAQRILREASDPSVMNNAQFLEQWKKATQRSRSYALETTPLREGLIRVTVAFGEGEDDPEYQKLNFTYELEGFSAQDDACNAVVKVSEY